MNCNNCNKELVIKNIKGQRIPYKDARLEIEKDFFVKGCPTCSDFILNAGQAKALDDILEPTYQESKEIK